MANRIRQPPPKIGLGQKILLMSALLGLCGVAPLMLYVLLGPANGNPVGLGLLAMVAVPVSMAGIVIGAVTLAVQWARRIRH